MGRKAGGATSVTSSDHHLEDSDGPRQSSNRRTAFRLATTIEVRVRIEGSPRGTDTWKRADGGRARELTTVTEDVSAGGLRFRAPAVVQRGAPVTVAFALDGTPVEAAGAVAHVEADEFGAGVGVQFSGVDGATTSRLVRFITTRERLRLPTVSIMYSAQCHVDQGSRVLDGATEVCSPTFIRLLLSRSVPPGENLAVVVNVGRAEMRLGGRAVTCRRADQMWRTEVELGDLDGTVAAQWRDLVVRLRDSAR